MIVYVDMDDTLCDFTGAFNQALTRNPGIQFPQSQYRFFADLVPIPGGVETVNALRASDRFEPYILSAPSTRNPLSYTEKREWVERHFGLDLCGRLILCENKALLRGDILIDDYASGKGQEHFEGRLIQFGSSKYPDWASVRAELGL